MQYFKSPLRAFSKLTRYFGVDQIYCLSKVRNPIALVAIGAGLSMALSACTTSNLGINPGTAPQTAPVLTANPSGEVFGQGKTRVALLIPATAPGNAAAVAQEIKNGALMAMTDFGQNTIQLVVKDTIGQPATAQSRATEAVGEGASIILGPLFSSSVSAASAITQPANRPMIAFSTDTSVAKQGVYLLSYTPQDDVNRVVTYAAAQGRKSIIAFLPQSSYGAVVEASLRQAAGKKGVSIVHIARYERSAKGMEETIGQATQFLESADSLYIPEGGGIPSAVMASLARLRLDVRGKQILGSGGWESVKLRDPRLNGAIYPGRDITGFAEFSTRYEAQYSTKPGVNAAIGYGAVTLVSNLVQRHGEKAFTPRIIQDRNGYKVVNGIFRFDNKGIAERGLAIYQVREGRGQLLEPAPTTFGFAR